MARRRKPPSRHIKKINRNRYWVAAVYTPDGGRRVVHFGPVEAHEASDVHAAFARWLKLFEANPHKCLVYDSPWAAIERMADERSIITVDDLIRSYRR